MVWRILVGNFHLPFFIRQKYFSLYTHTNYHSLFLSRSPHALKCSESPLPLCLPPWKLRLVYILIHNRKPAILRHLCVILKPFLVILSEITLKMTPKWWILEKTSFYKSDVIEKKVASSLIGPIYKPIKLVEPICYWPINQFAI